MKVGIVFPQMTSEAEVSQATKGCIVLSMQRLGLNYCELPFTDNFVNDVKKLKVDVIFNAMHGKFGEDGYIQIILNALKIPYTHSGVYASQISMNKITTNSYARACNIPMLNNFTILKEDLLNGNCKIEKKSVIKPVNGGSSVATFILNEGQELSDLQLKEIEGYADGNLFMVEEYFKGCEVSIGIFGNEVLGYCKITSAEEFYSYNAKYHSTQTVYQTSGDVPFLESLKRDAMALHNAIGAKVISRVDYLVSESEYKMLEINTHPGMTQTSLIPKIGKDAGISYDDMIQYLVNSAEFEQFFV